MSAVPDGFLTGVGVGAGALVTTGFGVSGFTTGVGNASLDMLGLVIAEEGLRTTGAGVGEVFGLAGSATLGAFFTGAGKGSALVSGAFAGLGATAGFGAISGSASTGLGVSTTRVTVLRAAEYGISGTG